jgi:hypothetical protein
MVFPIFLKILNFLGYALQNEGTTKYVSASGGDNAQLFNDRGSFNSYEGFYLTYASGSTTTVSIKSQRYRFQSPRRLIYLELENMLQL